MLKLSNLSLRRGKRELLHDVSITIHAGQRVGLTGANGVGKSSLFSLIRSEIQADAGDFFLPTATVIAHVAQETPAVNRAAIEYVIDGDVQLRNIEARIESSQAEGQGEVLANCYSEKESIDGYTAPSRASKLLHGLGFSTEQEQQAVMEFSGGWRMRLNLAQALMCRSDLLLLDEPTNHLDLDTVMWLEDWLKNYSGTLLLISHDRDFLDQVATHIANIELTQLNIYTGNYSAFEIRRAEQLANQQAAFEKQQREITHMESFVTRFRAKATKAKQAQSRIKALERMTIISQAHVDSPFNFSFSNAEKMPNQLLKIEQANAGYSIEGQAATTVLSNINLAIMAGDRIGLLGHNGAGKSTLIKLIANTLAPQVGEIVIAKDINIGYFAQHQLEQLDDEASPILHLQRLDPKASEKSLRSFLGGFAFTNDMALAPVAPFSGGEKARLVLAMIVYQRPNLLLLDEPTNHLDLEMRHSLSVALQEFDGAMVIVSHDRHLLRTVTDTLLLVADGQVSPFDGDLDDYRVWVKQQFENDNGPSIRPLISGGINKKQRRQQTAETRRELKEKRNRLKKLENQLDQLGRDKQSLHDRLADSDIYLAENKDSLNQCLQKQRQVGQQLEGVEQEWLELSETLQDMEN